MTERPRPTDTGFFKEGADRVMNPSRVSGSKRDAEFQAGQPWKPARIESAAQSAAQWDGSVTLSDQGMEKQVVVGGNLKDYRRLSMGSLDGYSWFNHAHHTLSNGPRRMHHPVTVHYDPHGTAYHQPRSSYSEGYAYEVPHMFYAEPHEGWTDEGEDPSSVEHTFMIFKSKPFQ